MLSFQRCERSSQLEAAAACESMAGGAEKVAPDGCMRLCGWLAVHTWLAAGWLLRCECSLGCSACCSQDLVYLLHTRCEPQPHYYFQPQFPIVLQV